MKLRHLIPSALLGCTLLLMAGSTVAQTAPVLSASASFAFTPIGGNKAMTWREAFDANHSDGIIVLHQGRVVDERYAGCPEGNTLHGAMSVTKSLTGLLASGLTRQPAAPCPSPLATSAHAVISSSCRP